MTDEDAFRQGLEIANGLKKKRTPFKKLSEAEKREKIVEGLSRKKECESRALEIVERLLEPDVDRVWFETEALKGINAPYYEDVVEERSLLKMCGYPLCSSPLPKNIPKQKYRIVSSEKKIYDLSDRKKFCSNPCFNGSSYLRAQLSSEPLWMMNSAFESKEIRILNGNLKSPGKEIPLSSVKTGDIGDYKSFGDPSTHEALDEDEESQTEELPDVSDLLEDLRLQEQLPNQPALIAVKQRNSTVTFADVIRNRIREWATTETLRFLKGDDFVWTCLIENHYGPEKITSVLGANPVLSPDVLSSYNKLVGKNIKKTSNDSLLPNFDPQDNLKLEAFLMGKTEITEVVKDETDNEETPRIPRGPSRREIVRGQLEGVLPEVLALFGLHISDISDDLNKLLGSFYYTSTNVILPREKWTFMALVVLEMIREKNVKLRTVMRSKESKKYLNMMLLNFDSDQNMLHRIVEFACEDINTLINKGSI